MRTIYKYPLLITDGQQIDTYTDAKPLFVDEQFGVLCLWMEVDTDKPKSIENVYIVGTGNPMPDRELTHVGSCIMPPFVWHVYVEAQ